MAGIGFHLQELFNKDYYSSRIKAYSFAGLTTAGPWIIITVSMGLIQWIINHFSTISTNERELFIFSVSYCFIFSQVIFSSQQYIATRYVSDLFFEKRHTLLFPAFLGITKVITGIAVVFWGVFAFISPLSLVYKIALLILFLTINYIWVLLLFLSAAKNYKKIAWAFLTGGVISIILTFLICKNEGTFNTGSHLLSFLLLAGFTFGMLVTLYILLLSLLKTFPDWGTKGQFSYFAYFGRFPSLFFIGILYNLGIWVCNWVIWFGEGSKIVEGSFIVHPIYDMALFWSYLTILPTIILFVISIETRFYRSYKIFFNYVNNGGTLSQIRNAKDKMFKVLIQEIQRLLRAQFIVTITVILTAGYVFRWLSLDEKFIQVFRITAIGAFANGILLVMLLLLLYFEDRKGALYSTMIFFSLNLLLTIFLLPGGFNYYGLSFAIGSIISFVFTTVRLVIYLKSIEYHAFCGQGVHIKSSANNFQRFGKWLEKHQIM